jgi:hypothetical protein
MFNGAFVSHLRSLSQRFPKWEPRPPPQGTHQVFFFGVRWKIPQIYIMHSNSVQLFIIYVPSQQLQGHLQTRHSLDTSNYIMEQYNIKSKTN